MDDAAKLIAQTGTLGAALLVVGYFLGRIVMRVADRLISAIDRVGAKIDEHTVNEQAHVGELRSDIAIMKERLRIDSMEMEPIRKTPAYGVKKRNPTEGDR